MSSRKTAAKAITVPQHFEPRDYQRDLLVAMDNGMRNFFLVWPRQVGKDTTCWAVMCREAVRRPGNYFYIFPEATQAKEALWDKVMSEESEGIPIIDMIPKQLIESVNNQSMQLKLKNGSKISVMGLDTKPDKIRGVTPTGMVFSEFGFSNNMFEGYKIASPSFRREGMWQIINSTPNGENHFYDMYNGVKDNPAWFVSFKQAFYPDEPGFTILHMFKDWEEQYAYYEDLVQTGRSTWDEIEREYGCSFQAGRQGSYYNDCINQAEESGRVGNFVYDDTKLVDTFWDIGRTDDAPVWFRQVSDNRIIFIDYCEDAGRGPRDYVSMLSDRGYRYRTHFLPHDAGHGGKGFEGETTAELFEMMLDNFELSGNIQVLPKAVNKQNGINTVRARFSRYHFDEHNCHLGLRHLKGYARDWDKNNRCFRETPKHDEHSHAADALRYEAESGDEGSWSNRPKQIKVLTGLDTGDL
jgi:hypothetical protein